MADTARTARAASTADTDAARPPSPRARKLTFDEFHDWLDEDTWAERVDGEVIVLSPASLPHQEVVLFVGFLMSAFADALQLGKVLVAPFLIRLRAGHSDREPDIVFVAREHLDRLHRTYLDGPPDVIVEVVSPDSEHRDRVDKFGEYAAAGVREYWMLDPDRQQADFYQLDASGQYQRVAPDDAGAYRSAALTGFWLRVGWLWQDPLPKIAALQELRLVRAPNGAGK